MKQVVEEIIRLDKIIPGGQVMGQLADGRKVFVWGALPGETAKIRLTKSKHHYAEGVAIDIIESSPDRVEPRDDCYLSTSPWQIIRWEVENKYKSQLTTEAFRQFKIDIQPGQIVTDNVDYGYRNKMEYSLWWDHDSSRIWPAFHKRSSHQKIMVKSSSIERPEIWEEAKRVIERLNDSGDDARRYQSLLIRSNQLGQVSSALFVNKESHPKMTQLHDTILGRDYSYSPNGFFQINLPVYQLALRDIEDHLVGDRIVDMYSGVGTIGLSVARDKNLILVETDKSAFGELENNLPSGSDNIQAINAKSEDALDHIISDSTIIVDPPRAGLDIRVVEKILGTLPQQVIYLSCNPATQARDVSLLLKSYKIDHCQSFNFFPRTPHIENLIILSLA